ncbi:MAG: hypothetical protein GY799_12615 [Desulfobulbaceae bacterium]|nr:hypothetical protein [Desulfobulbaceae bacterium]
MSIGDANKSINVARNSSPNFHVYSMQILPDDLETPTRLGKKHMGNYFVMSWNQDKFIKSEKPPTEVLAWVPIDSAQN